MPEGPFRLNATVCIWLHVAEKYKVSYLCISTVHCRICSIKVWRSIIIKQLISFCEQIPFISGQQWNFIYKWIQINDKQISLGIQNTFNIELLPVLWHITKHSKSQPGSFPRISILGSITYTFCYCKMYLQIVITCKL